MVSVSLRRCLSLTLAFIFCFACLVIPAYADYNPGDSGIVPAGQSKDIFLNIDSEMMDQLAISSGNPSLSADDIMSDLRDYLIENGEGEYNGANLRIRSNVTKIDTTDLSSWHVYDHYDTGTGGTADTTGAAYKGNEAIFQTGLRPYNGVMENAANTNNYNNDKYGGTYTAQQAKTFSSVYTIEYMLDPANSAELLLEPGTLNGSRYNSQTLDGAKASNVRKLKEHIYSYNDEDGAHMYFMGYGNIATNRNLTDFLFYPATTKDTKTIEFEINSADVRTHSMIGAGFLLNTGINQAGEIEGYILYIVFTPQGSDTTGSNKVPTGATMFLYKINSDTQVRNFHTRNGDKSSNCALSYCTKVAEVTNSNALFLSAGSFKNAVSLKIEFDETSLSVTADGTEAIFEKNDQIVDLSDYDLSTGYYGFGPLVDYAAVNTTGNLTGQCETGITLGAGHSCQTTSSYKFSNLKMSFASDVLDTLLNTQFYCAQNVDRFYVNLISEQIDDTNPKFWDGIALLRSDKVFYVTNADNEIIGENGANLNNGLKLEKTAYAEIIAELGDYILNNSLSNWQDENLPPSGLNKPAMGYDLLGSDNNATNKVVDRVEKQMIKENPITFSFLDKSEYNSGTIEKFEVKWYGPDGNEIPDFGQTILYDSSGDIYILENAGIDHLSTVGIYTVEIVAVGTDLTESAPVSRSFELVEDTEDPTCELDAASKANLSAALYKGDSVILNLSDTEGGWGANAYRVGFGPAGETLADMDDILWESADIVYLPERWLNPPYRLSIPELEQQAECLYVQIWDWVGNDTLYMLPIAPYSVTVSEENAFGLDLSAFTMPVGPDGNYQTLYQYNSDVYTPNVNGETTGNGKYELIGFDTDKYAETVSSSFKVTGNMILYPIFEYIGDTIDIVLDYDKSGPFPNIEINIDPKDDLQNPVTLGDGTGYIVLEFDENDTIPDSFSDNNMEKYADSGSGWTDLDSNQINIPSGQLKSGKKYVVLIKIVDENGNVSYSATDPIECFISGPDSSDSESGSNTIITVGPGGSISGPAATDPGSDITFTITPDSGKRILDVLVDGVSVGGAGSVTVKGTDKNTTLSATFTDAGNFIVDAKPQGNGSVSNPGRTAHEPGTSTTHVFSPGAGFVISDVLINGVSAGAVGSYTVDNISGDVVIIPVFVPLSGLNTGDHFAYVIGYPDGLVHPLDFITREEIAEIFFRLLSDDFRDANLSYENNFDDVLGDRWSNCAISTLANAGILKGKSESHFDPGSYITRAELAAIAARFIDARYNGSSMFSDISGHWAENEINIAAINGWVIGDEGVFRPNDNITRAEAMMTINRALGRLPESPDDLLDDMIVWSDNADENIWYYLDIQEATNSHDCIRKEDDKHESWTEINSIPDWTKWVK